MDKIQREGNTEKASSRLDEKEEKERRLEREKDTTGCFRMKSNACFRSLCFFFLFSFFSLAVGSSPFSILVLSMLLFLAASAYRVLLALFVGFHKRLPCGRLMALPLFSLLSPSFSCMLFDEPYHEGFLVFSSKSFLYRLRGFICVADNRGIGV